MKLEVGNYVITSDERQFIVNEKGVIKDETKAKSENIGKPILKPIGYFTNIKSALNFIPQKTLMQNNELLTVVEMLKNIENDINSLPKPIQAEKIAIKEVKKKDEKITKKEVNKIPLELQKKIVDAMPDEDLEDAEPIEVYGIKYTWETEKELVTEDEGKYQHGGTVYSVGLLDENDGYGINGEPMFYVQQNFSQTGSYYEFQEREYEKPYIVTKKTKTIEVWER